MYSELTKMTVKAVEFEEHAKGWRPCPLTAKTFTVYADALAYEKKAKSHGHEAAMVAHYGEECSTTCHATADATTVIVGGIV